LYNEVLLYFSLGCQLAFALCICNDAPFSVRKQSLQYNWKSIPDVLFNNKIYSTQLFCEPGLLFDAVNLICLMNKFYFDSVNHATVKLKIIRFLPPLFPCIQMMQRKESYTVPSKFCRNYYIPRCLSLMYLNQSKKSNAAISTETSECFQKVLFSPYRIFGNTTQTSINWRPFAVSSFGYPRAGHTITTPQRDKSHRQSKLCGERRTWVKKTFTSSTCFTTELWWFRFNFCTGT